MAQLCVNTKRSLCSMLGDVCDYIGFIDALYDENNKEVNELFKQGEKGFLAAFDALPDTSTYMGSPYIVKDEFIISYLNREKSAYVNYVISKRPNYKLNKSTIWTLKMNYKIATMPEDPNFKQYIKDKNRKIRYTYENLFRLGLIE